MDRKHETETLDEDAVFALYGSLYGVQTAVDKSKETLFNFTSEDYALLYEDDKNTVKQTGAILDSLAPWMTKGLGIYQTKTKKDPGNVTEHSIEYDGPEWSKMNVNDVPKLQSNAKGALDKINTFIEAKTPSATSEMASIALYSLKLVALAIKNVITACARFVMSQFKADASKNNENDNFELKGSGVNKRRF